LPVAGEELNLLQRF